MTTLATEITVPDALAQGAQDIEPMITLTERAVSQFRRVLTKKAIPGAFIRLGVKGGGCSGLSYVMKPDTEADDFDRTWLASEDVRVVIDKKSITYLTGTTIDYSVKNLLEGGFTFDNPNSVKSCGCGTSFTPK